MKVPFFDLKRVYQLQKAEIDAAVARTLESGWYILGEQCAALERECAAALAPRGGTEFVGCNSGTDALVLAMLAAGVNPGDEVITVSHTAVPTITAIRSIGAVPVFLDVDPETWLMDLTSLAAAITSRTRAVIPVHLYGAMVNVPAIQDLLKRSGRDDVAVIEDVAQAQGSAWKGTQAGTLARFGSFSFYPTKNIGCLGDGGGIACKSADDSHHLRVLRNYGQKDRYNAQYARGINSRLDEIQAAVLRVKLPRIEAWNDQRNAMVKTYRAELRNLPVRFQAVDPACAPGWHLCVIRLENRETRDRLMGFLKERGVDTIIHYPLPSHTQPVLGGERPPRLPVTEKLAGEIVSLPMNIGLKAEEQNHVIEQVRAFFAG